MKLRLALVPIPVRDVDQAKAFYAGQLGFRVDQDVRPTTAVRVVQLTPPGSDCAILLASGLPALDNEPGSLRGMHLAVDDIDRARRELLQRGVAVQGVDDLGGVLYAGFEDPDGNTWTLQQPVDSTVARVAER